MFWRHTYSLVGSSSDDGEGAQKTRMQLSNWCVPRRVRTAIAAAAVLLLLIVVVSFRYPDLHERIQELAHNATATVPTTCDCSATEIGTPSSNNETSSEPSVRWSDFAYVQYVTNPSYLCNSVMIFEALRRHKTKADLLMMYPQNWELPDRESQATTLESKLLVQTRDKWKAKMVPIELKTFKNMDDPTWEDSYTKLLAFNQTQYKRVISLDSDATVLDHMDELFLLPSAPVAMPRAYWMDKFFLSSQLIVIEPSEAEWKRVEYATDHHDGHDYDMDILNKMYEKSSTVIPHRRYDLLTGELHNDKHENYLGNQNEKWDARKILEEAKFLHFSDWPMPKPWWEPLSGMVEKYQPACRKVSETEEDCSDREVWLYVRKDFSDRRERICGMRYDGKARPITRKRSLRPKYEPVFA